MFGGSMPQGSSAPGGFGSGGLTGQSSGLGGSSLFGGSSTGLFGGQQGQQNPPQQSSGLFGSLNNPVQQTQQDKPSFFSNLPGSSGSIFGNLGGSSLFGNEANNSQPSQPSLFGGPMGSGGSTFGGASNSAPQASSLFGNPSQPPSLQPSSLFDPSRNSFTMGSSNPQSSVFSPNAQAPPVSGLNQGATGFLGQQSQNQMGQLPASQVNAELLRAKESIAHLERALGSINAPSATAGAPRDLPLPPGWAKQWDLNRQAFFYINCNNNPPTVQWEPPPPPINPMPSDSNSNGTPLGPLYSFLNRLWGSSPPVSSEVRPANPFATSVVPAVDGVRPTWNSPGDIAVIRLLVSAFAGAAGSIFSIGQLLIFVFECIARIMAKRGAPLIASAVKGLLEGPAAGNQLSSYVRNMRFGSGPRGGTRPGAEQLLEPGRFLFICGGRRDMDNATTANTIIYDRMSGNWEAGPDMIRPRVSARAAVLNGELYVVGGWDGRSVLSSVERLDVSLGRWVRVADLRIPRASPALAVLDGFLYVMGGFDGQDWLRQVERYDAAKDEWEEVASLSAPRSAFGACALNGSIYAVGGSDGQMSQRSVEKYNPWEDRWVPVAGMTTRRENLGVAVVNGQMFAAGGFDSMWAEWLRTSERYDASACAWVSAPDLKSPRRNCILLTFNGELLAIGGNDGKDQVKDVERLILDGSSMEGCWRSQPDLRSIDLLSSPVLPLPRNLCLRGGVAASNKSKAEGPAQTRKRRRSLLYERSTQISQPLRKGFQHLNGLPAELYELISSRVPHKVYGLMKKISVFAEELMKMSTPQSLYKLLKYVQRLAVSFLRFLSTSVRNPALLLKRIDAMLHKLQDAVWRIILELYDSGNLLIAKFVSFLVAFRDLMVSYPRHLGLFAYSTTMAMITAQGRWKTVQLYSELLAQNLVKAAAMPMQLVNAAILYLRREVPRGSPPTPFSPLTSSPLLSWFA
ncbi:hypothetical protein GUITHDRAFT_166251 [Guillardia theta CCMP2712]|uniref:WW domain-containing protein n=1 Tax=Guillardia theta (strain CCMP2712) TaxID=905079 RepID=L1IET8_GUITC|nr:hypothetical protein GUITHDRAFT_166251 [Guillardia theta CCMP2712]EKX34345.1 hypothetical protein GUITHDRAFT_166251 [Guillardia theta CCMP2712]|eukprot:XP_005821325.1 hypothetical protein GUITHDRAFT_166251 [Guillardia theta CCMP2712]